MNLLAFDTSTELMSIAVQCGDDSGQTTVWQHTAPGGAQTSAHLIPAIQGLMAQANLKFEQLHAIVFGCGPGSFTGLRTACSVAQGLAFGANVPVLPIATLLAVAEEARNQYAPQQAIWQVWALLDARMDEMYAACYEFDKGHWTEIAGGSLIRPEDLGAGPHTVLAGNVFAAYGARLPAPAPSPTSTEASPSTDSTQPGVPQWLEALPTAAALLRLAPALLAAGGALSADQALPLYIRDKVAKTTLERAVEKAAL
ncbi:MAG: tRNA (adenosine(37)-N6)-threonylcarbamoyltransferase complex dimerization subunit type 1 TsaB [Rhodoferax sp.]|nr:tRNA (adenosine(37)-N6)-threonylcarbamoyltransferase complex dimerization subunit type 1 TsaB [Rhodoferax sp.]